MGDEDDIFERLGQTFDHVVLCVLRPWRLRDVPRNRELAFGRTEPDQGNSRGVRFAFIVDLLPWIQAVSLNVERHGTVEGVNQSLKVTGRAHQMWANVSLAR